MNYYTVTNVEAVEDFEPDQYGNVWYNVKFAEHADGVLWLAKTEPMPGQKVYGHLEKTKSGKRYRFKKDPLPDGAGSSEPAVPIPQPKLKEGGVPATDRSLADGKFLKDTSDLPFRVWQSLLPYIDQQHMIKSQEYSDKLNEFVSKQTGLLLTMIDEIRTGRKPLKEFVDKQHQQAEIAESGLDKARAKADELRKVENITDEFGKDELEGLFP
jgi:hypothetical protein